MPVNVILAIGFDSLTFESQRAGWSSAGSFVTPAASISEGLKLFREGDFDAVLLGGLLSAERRERIISFIRSMGSRVPVVCVPAHSGGCGSCEFLKTHDEPEALMLRIKQLLVNPEKNPLEAPVAIYQAARTSAFSRPCTVDISRSGIRRSQNRTIQAELDIDRLPPPITIDSPCVRGGSHAGSRVEVRAEMNAVPLSGRLSNAG